SGRAKKQIPISRPSASLRVFSSWAARMHSYQSVGRSPFRVTTPPSRLRTIPPETPPRARMAAIEYVQSLLRTPHPELALRMPAPALGVGPFRAADPASHRTPSARRVHYAHTQAEEEENTRATAGDRV